MHFFHTGFAALRHEHRSLTGDDSFGSIGEASWLPFLVKVKAMCHFPLVVQQCSDSEQAAVLDRQCVCLSALVLTVFVSVVAAWAIWLTFGIRLLRFNWNEIVTVGT